jgi:D-alanyl-lipoteichoic acid acyltransferase DltB (MBOAT superfamily)
LYIPLGGSKNRIVNTFIVFTFVAIWHDIELRLLIWGWLIALFILPEVVLSSLAKKYVCQLIRRINPNF